MSGPTEAQMRAWVAQWRAAGVALEQQRWQEIRAADLRVIAEQLEDVFQASLRADPPRPTSGLIEQQRLFHSARPS